MLSSLFRVTALPRLFAPSTVSVFAPAIAIRAFAHGRHKFAANGSKRFKKQERPVNPEAARKSVRLQHKMKKLVLRRQREAEVTKMAQAASSDAAVDTEVAAAPSAAAQGLTDEQRKAALLAEVPTPEGIRADQLRFGVQPWMVGELSPSIRKMLEFRNASNREVVKRRTLNWASDLGGSEANTGDSAVQIAALTEKIRNLTDHMREHHKDMHSRRGLDTLLNRRRRLMWYFRRTDFARYSLAIAKLGLPDVPPPL